MTLTRLDPERLPGFLLAFGTKGQLTAIELGDEYRSFRREHGYEPNVYQQVRLEGMILDSMRVGVLLTEWGFIDE